MLLLILCDQHSSVILTIYKGAIVGVVVVIACKLDLQLPYGTIIRTITLDWLCTPFQHKKYWQHLYSQKTLIYFTSPKYLQDMYSLRGENWAHETSTKNPHFIEMQAPS